MSNKDITEIAYRKQYYRDNLEKKREDARKYYHRNKEVLNAEKREKTAIRKAAALAEKLRTEGVIVEVPSKPKRIPNRTKSIETLKAERSSDTYNMYQIAKIIGITYSKLRSKVAVNPRYMMPKHMYIMLDGSKVYNKAEIDEWLPYIIDCTSV
jgi:Tfp pilus assembly protein PilX